VQIFGLRERLEIDVGSELFSGGYHRKCPFFL
jgi:hypothetical protein